MSLKIIRVCKKKVQINHPEYTETTLFWFDYCVSIPFFLPNNLDPNRVLLTQQLNHWRYFWKSFNYERSILLENDPYRFRGRTSERIKSSESYAMHHCILNLMKCKCFLFQRKMRVNNNARAVYKRLFYMARLQWCKRKWTDS